MEVERNSKKYDFVERKLKAKLIEELLQLPNSIDERKKYIDSKKIENLGMVNFMVKKTPKIINQLKESQYLITINKKDLSAGAGPSSENDNSQLDSISAKRSERRNSLILGKAEPPKKTLLRSPSVDGGMKSDFNVSHDEDNEILS